MITRGLCPCQNYNDQLPALTNLPLASYGSLARFRDVQRIVSVNNNTLVGASGDMSDFQEIERKLQALE